MHNTMRAIVLSATICLLTAACTTGPNSNFDEGPLAYGCSDLVVVGRLANKGSEQVISDGDILGHGWMTADLRVVRMVVGERPAASIPVTYFAHTYMREDRDFMFVLSPQSDANGYVIAEADLMSNSPRAAETCR